MSAPNRRILVVDDDRTIWSSYELILTPAPEDSDSPLEQLKTALESSPKNTEYNKYSFNLSFASQGQEGLQLVRKAHTKGTPFSLAFIDVRMPPGWDGMETARQIRRFDPNIEIVIVSAYSDRSSTEITKTVGSAHKLLFFRKPFDPDELKQLAISLTDKYHLSLKEENQRNKLEVLVNNSSAAIFTVDITNTLLTWNRAAEQITGYSAEEVVGNTLILDSITDDSETLLGRRVEADDSSIFNRHITIRDKQGNSRVISLNLAQIEGRTAKDKQTIGSFWDITIHKTTERALTQTNLELKKQIEEKDILQEKKFKLERKLNQAQKMEAIGLMAGGVAHDLNNILSGIVGYPDILLMDLPEDSKYRDSIMVIRDSGKRAAAVVADLLTVARGVAVEKEVADLNNLIIEYLESAEGKLLKKNFPDVVITTNLATQTTAILCSPVHIKKCMMNLLNNAAEAMTTSWQIEITTDIQELDPQGGLEFNLPEGFYVTLIIKDNGPGIPPQDLKHIFEPFFTKKKIGLSGTGLGLAVVWNTVLDHNGAINVESDSSGTTFKLFFPLSKAQLTRESDPIMLNNLQGEGSIMVVDDEALQRRITKEMLQKLGYSVITAASGEEAVTYLETEAVDLILLDMIMHPGINGLQTYTEIIKCHPKQKAIITSGYSESNEVIQAKKLGVGEFISKPFSIEQVGQVIKKVLT